jgi:predicted Zn finger-like uncharacterized protein
VKFLCDRCKTRYSIGDERVRGKILKIRCKNCANVITVREGMPDADAPANAGMPRRNKTTTAAPLVAQAEAVAPVANNGSNKNALGAAFASAMTKPAPAALEEEWYVSIDGDQSGPFSLAEAQQWVAGKPFDAELHCWSEGFDDWLPVDKVSHFRGLRKKPAPPPMPAAPPPIPRVGTGPARAITSAPARAEIAARIPQNFEENTPKPLFAATMASLEKSASQPTAMANGGGMAAVASGAAAVQARAAIPAVTPVQPGSRPTPYVNGGITARGAALPSAKPAVTAKGVGLSPLAAKHAFDSSELAGATKVEVPAFTDEPPDEPATVPAPHLKSVDKLTGPNDAFLDALATARDQDKVPALGSPNLSLSALADAKRAEEAAPEPPDDDLDIGEVSRVVNLADIARTPKPAAKPTNQTGAVNRINQTNSIARINQTGSVGRLSGSIARINGTAPVPLMDAVDAVPSGNVMPMPAEPTAEPSSKRGLIVLMICAALLLGGAAIVVIKMLGTTDDVTNLGGNYEYNGERPDDPVARRTGDPNGSATEPVNPYLPPKPKPRPQPIPNPGSAKPDIIEPKGDKLRSDEIESMAGKSAATTTACFRRADKGADAIRLADVKKIRVAFKVNADGSVDPGSIDLSEKSSATLTSCIQRMISTWKFRANPGGNFGFVFAKPD